MRRKLTTVLVRGIVLCAIICGNISCKKSKPSAGSSQDTAPSPSAVKCSQPDLTVLAAQGKNLTAQDAEKLEEQLSREPNDLFTRTKLLGFYSSQRFTSTQAQNSYQRHVLWVIENNPDNEMAGNFFTELDPILDGQAYLQAKQLWLTQVDNYPNNTTVIGNAAHFFLLSDSKIAEQLLKKAQSLESQNPKWPWKLAELYNLRTVYQKLPAQLENAKKSLKLMEKSIELTTSELEKFYVLGDTAKVAYKAGCLEKADNYAKELLQLAPKYPQDWNYGNALHHANIILGRIALAQNDIESAKKCLIEAGKTPGSPQLNSFGPNMMLAKELLEKSEREVVLQYFQLCASFWKRGNNQLDEWSAIVKAGRIPDFQANLSY